MSKTYVPKPLRQQVNEDAQRRCGYCLTSQQIIGRPMAIDHIIPEAKGIVGARWLWVQAGWHPPTI